MRFDITTLSLVHAIAQTRSITRGAAREHLALAAASKRLADLECRLGVPLFIRRARGVELTKAGEAMVRHVDLLRNTLNALEGEIAKFAAGVKGKLRIGAAAGVIAEWLPRDIATFAQLNPEIQVSLQEMTSVEGVLALADDAIDVGVFRLPTLKTHVDSWAYRQGRLALLVPRGHYLETPWQVSLDDILDQHLILHSKTDWSQEVLVEAAQARGKELTVRCYARDANAVAELVQQGIGIAVMPESIAAQICDTHMTRALKLSGEWAAMDYRICARPGIKHPVATQRLIDLMASERAPAPVKQTGARAA